MIKSLAFVRFKKYICKSLMVLYNGMSLENLENIHFVSGLSEILSLNGPKKG